MSKLKTVFAAGALAIALAGCSKPAADNAATMNTVEVNAMTTDAAPTNDVMMSASENADEMASPDNAMNSSDEDKSSSGGIILKQ